MANNEGTTVLIIDDEEMIRESLADILDDEGYKTIAAKDAETAKYLYDKYQPNVTLLDIWMPDIDGISLLKSWQAKGDLKNPIIMMSGHGTIETAVEATKSGAYDFLEKPLSTAKLLLTLERSLQAQRLKSENTALKAKVDPRIELIGKSKLIQQLRESANTLAKKQIPILLTGSAGTGKQHLAHFIHQKSNYCDANFTVANVSDIEAEYTVNTLIGTEQREGLIAKAEGGSLFINEINSLSRPAQQVLISLIEQREYFPFASSIPIKSNIRLLVASQLPLTELKTSLHPVLFEYLSVAHIGLPNLFEYRDDIPELLEYFSQYFADVEQMTYRHFSLAAQNTLRQYQWPGNIRELRNFVQRLLIRGSGQEIEQAEAKTALAPSPSQKKSDLWSQLIPKDLSLKEARELFERQYLLEQFSHCDGNIAKLASRVGMDRTNLYRKLRGLGIDPTSKPG